jgi:multidrug efflux pump subunit AcrA (membrane-fusion protein)
LVKQNEDCEHEILRLQAQITAFESQLDRQQREFEDGEIAKTELVKQKEANLELQAENELLKRNHMPQALSPDLAGRLGVPGGSAGPSTFSRNLGAEFARRLEDDDEMEPGILEETVTTRVVCLQLSA